MFYEGSLNAEDYCRILDEGLLTTGEVLHPDGYNFIQDNDPCHAAANTTTGYSNIRADATVALGKSRFESDRKFSNLRVFFILMFMLQNYFF